MVNFTQEDSDTILITGSIKGLDAESIHGFHIHEYGNFSDGCTSFGGHYNPFNQTHGAPEDTVRHVGDLGNIQADSTGEAVISLEDLQVKLSGDQSVIGRGCMVHSGEDDLGLGGDSGSLTTGNAGSRLACGIIYSYDSFGVFLMIPSLVGLIFFI